MRACSESGGKPRVEAIGRPGRLSGAEEGFSGVEPVRIMKGWKDYQGSDQVFSWVKNLIASITPSFTPSPESRVPPKGVNSKR